MYIASSDSCFDRVSNYRYLPFRGSDPHVLADLFRLLLDQFDISQRFEPCSQSVDPLKVIAMFKRGDVGFIRAETLGDHERFLEAFDDRHEEVSGVRGIAIGTDRSGAGALGSANTKPPALVGDRRAPRRLRVIIRGSGRLRGPRSWARGLLGGLGGGALK